MINRTVARSDVNYLPARPKIMLEKKYTGTDESKRGFEDNVECR